MLLTHEKETSPEPRDSVPFWGVGSDPACHLVQRGRQRPLRTGRRGTASRNRHHWFVSVLRKRRLIRSELGPQKSVQVRCCIGSPEQVPCRPDQSCSR